MFAAIFENRHGRAGNNTEKSVYLSRDYTFMKNVLRFLFISPRPKKNLDFFDCVNLTMDGVMNESFTSQFLTKCLSPVLFIGNDGSNSNSNWVGCPCILPIKISSADRAQKEVSKDKSRMMFFILFSFLWFE